MMAWDIIHKKTSKNAINPSEDRVIGNYDKTACWRYTKGW